MAEPPEQEISPGIFVTDFRTPASIAAAQQAAAQEQQHHRHEQKLQHTPPAPSHTEHKQSLPSSSPTHSSLVPSDPGASDVNQLSLDLHQLHNSIDHLIASNAEMVVAMEEDAAEGKPEDDEYACAIRENMLLIDRKQNEAAELQALLDSMLGGHALDRPIDSTVGTVVSSTASTSSSSSSGHSEGDDSDGMYL